MAKAKSPADVLKSLPKSRGGQRAITELMTSQQRAWYLEFIELLKATPRLERPAYKDIRAAIAANIGVPICERTLRKAINGE